MRLFKRISSTLLASVDNVVSQVENHDAVVESMLQELTQATAESKIRLKRIQSDGKKLQQQIHNLGEQETQWTQRAKKLANEAPPESQEQALACLERRRGCREQRQRLEERLTQHQATEQKITQQVQAIEQRHSEISDKRHLLKSQQATAEASRVVAAVTGSSSIDDAFDRWEIAITKAELSNPGVNSLDDEPHDAFATQWVQSEQREALLDELAELQQTGTNDSNNKEA